MDRAGSKAAVVTLAAMCMARTLRSVDRDDRGLNHI